MEYPHSSREEREVLEELPKELQALFRAINELRTNPQHYITLLEQRVKGCKCNTKETAFKADDLKSTAPPACPIGEDGGGKSSSPCATTAHGFEASSAFASSGSRLVSVLTSVGSWVGLGSQQINKEDQPGSSSTQLDSTASPGP
ncbi:unnamed protein product, partial [Heterosigma akashiwo]